MTIRIVAAMDGERGIGVQGRLPWNLPSELKHFQNWTRDTACVMGRKTFDAIGRLPGRGNYVVSRDSGYRCNADAVGYCLTHSLKQAAHYEVISIIGGGEIFRNALDIADEILLTRVNVLTLCSDTFFPRFRWRDWGLGRRVARGVDSGLSWEARLYKRKR